jgi:SIR2-like domain
MTSEMQAPALNPPLAATLSPEPTNTVGYCPYRQAVLIQQALAPDKMRIAFFVGAGCPVSIRVTDESGAKPLIPDVMGLTKVVRQVLEQSADHKQCFATVLSRLAKSGTKNPNIEEVLSYIRALVDVVGGGEIEGLSLDGLNALDKRICDVTTDVVRVGLPGNDSAYQHLAAWIGGVLRSYPAEVFTSNYDLLMEQALEDRKVPYFDGFVGSYRTFFDLASIEQDKLPARWARLWKVHGSINWWRTATGDVERRQEGASGDRQMIYPSHLKYDQSRRLPYLAMLDRLKSFLGVGQSVLITCGYSFGDQHLNEAIIQGLSGNPNAMCFGLAFGDLATVPEGVLRAKKQTNLSLLAADGAVLGSVERPWACIEKLEHPLHGLAARAGDIGDRSSAPADRLKFLLGDFRSFGELLARQLAQRESN